MPNSICYRLHPPPRNSREEENLGSVSNTGSSLNTIICKSEDNILRHIVGQVLFQYHLVKHYGTNAVAFIP